MYHMHTGQPAIDGPAAGPYARLRAPDRRGHAAPAAPRRWARRSSQVIAKLLRRRDAYRYQSAREVWEDLRKLAWHR